MRWDSIGFFWEDRPVSRERGAKVLGPMPSIPDTGWRPPAEFPNLSGAKILGFDCETKDERLKTHGPGWGRHDGHIIGASLSVQDGSSWYFPIRHETQTELNMDPDQVIRFLRDALKTEIPKVGANVLYDVGWLAEENIAVNGYIYDVQFAEALLDSEAPNVSLDALSHKYLGHGKETSVLYEWLSMWFGGASDEKQRKWLFKSPPALAGPYAEADAKQPIQILSKQWPLMVQRGVLDLFHLECRLIPLLVKMRQKGAPVSVERAHRIYDDLQARMKQLEGEFTHIAGRQVSEASGDSMEAAFNALGIPVPTKFDKKKQVSKRTFEAAALETIDHPFTDKVLEYRKLGKVSNTFIKSYIIDKQVNGRIHCQFHPLKSDESGARSGRFASSDPNLQNIPVRTDEGKLVREAFVASQGNTWEKWDYSQIEYRMLAHFASGEGSDLVRQTFIDDPNTDYHELVGEIIKRGSGIEMARRPIKTINFGLIYGMGQPELAKRLKMKLPEAKSLFQTYHSSAPFIKHTMEAAADEARMFGAVTTILGRKSDFNLWGPQQFDPGKPGLPYGDALLAYGLIERAYTHKALNRKLQGSAADIMKKAMVDCYEAGIFDETHGVGIPILTVHDELDFDTHQPENHPAWAEMKRMMENCVPTRVPIRIDRSRGASWGTAD